MSLKILLADDHAILRQGLCSLLEKQDDMEVVAQTGDGREALELIREFLPDIVIMDITMPNLNGIDATKQIVERYPQIKVIALSMHSHRHFVVNMLKAGASGYILKESLFDELVQAIRTVAVSGAYLSSGITGIVVDGCIHRNQSETDSSLLAKLTVRERELLQLIAENKSTKEAARLLHLSIKTIDARRHSIMDKLGVSGIADLTKIAIKEGLISLDF